MIQRNQFVVTSEIGIFYLSVFGWVLFWTYHNYRFKKVTNERIEELKFLGNAIAHELRTPLGAIVGIGTSLEIWMPKFLDLARRSGALPMEPREIERLETMPGILKRLVRSSEMVINMLVEKIKHETGRAHYSEMCDSKKIVENALETYPLTEEENQQIVFNADNAFLFVSNTEAMKHVILNLLKNALYQIAKHKKGKIEIWFERHKNKNEIHFKDTAIGIQILDILKIFDKPLVSTSNGMGLGLLFCNLVAKASGGDIFCQSEYGDYVEFIISFPCLPETKA